MPELLTSAAGLSVGAALPEGFRCAWPARAAAGIEADLIVVGPANQGRAGQAIAGSTGAEAAGNARVKTAT